MVVQVVTLGAHAQQGYGSWVCLFVRYSTSHLSNVCSSHKRYDVLNWPWRSENNSDFSENAALQSYSATSIVRILMQVGHFTLRITRMRIIFDHVVGNDHFVSRSVRRRSPVFRELSCLRVTYAHSVKLLYTYYLLPGPEVYMRVVAQLWLNAQGPPRVLHFSAC